MSPKVSIIIPTLSPKSKRYLDLCIASIKALDYDQEQLEVIISSPKSYKPYYPDTKLVHHAREDREFAEAVNVAVSQSDPNSKHIFLLSDDVILTPNSLKNLARTAGDSHGLFAGISNCDNYWRYHLAFEVVYKGERQAIKERFMRYEDVDYLLPAMMKAESLYPSGALLTDQLCFYAVLIPRITWNVLGDLDERFQTGFEDTDYCERAKRAKVPMYIILNALIWHFGGVTSSQSVTPEQRILNEQLFNEKWSQTKEE